MPKHTAKFDRCVREVKRSLSKVDNPFAVCTAALGKKALLKNPVRDPEHKKLLKSLSHHFSKDEGAGRKRRGSWPKGKTPPHLKRYLFK